MMSQEIAHCRGRSAHRWVRRGLGVSDHRDCLGDGERNRDEHDLVVLSDIDRLFVAVGQSVPA